MIGLAAHMAKIGALSWVVDSVQWVIGVGFQGVDGRLVDRETLDHP